MVKLVSFFTPEKYYADHALRLGRECRKLGVDYHVAQLQTTNSYLGNCRMKPKFIRDCLIQFNTPIMWIDVDASIVKQPTWITDRISMAASGKPFDILARHMRKGASREWHVGTMVFMPTKDCMKFIDKWIENTGELSDESSLDYTLKNSGLPIKIENIPSQYFRIQGRDFIRKSDVIVHRISKTQVKKMEMPEAKRKREKGIY